MKRVFLHVGLHKTATSSIQRTLAANQGLLEQQGVLFPTFQFGEFAMSNHSIPMRSLFMDNPATYKQVIKRNMVEQIAQTNRAVKQQLQQLLESEYDLVLSGEGMSLMQHHELAKLRDYILRFNRELIVLCAVRRPYSFLCSELQQRVKGGDCNLSQIKVPSVSYRIDRIKQVFPAAIFYSFEQSCEHSLGPVGSFLERLELNQNEQFKVLRANDNIGNLSTRVYAHINQRYPAIVDGKLSSLRRQGDVIRLDNKPFHLTARELRKAKPSLKKENAQLESALGEGFCDRSYPVSEDITLNSLQAQQIYAEIGQPPHIMACVNGFIDQHSPKLSARYLRYCVNQIVRLFR